MSDDVKPGDVMAKGCGTVDQVFRFVYVPEPMQDLRDFYAPGSKIASQADLLCKALQEVGEYHDLKRLLVGYLGINEAIKLDSVITAEMVEKALQAQADAIENHYKAAAKAEKELDKSKVPSPLQIQNQMKDSLVSLVRRLDERMSNPNISECDLSNLASEQTRALYLAKEINLI